MSNTEYAEKIYYYSAIKVWHEIPIDIRELPTINRFKKTSKGVLEELTENVNLKIRPSGRTAFLIFILYSRNPHKRT